jgi:hypothetical protein
VHDARGVKGYLQKHDVLIWDALLEFQDAREIHGHMLEIGVHKGRSAMLSVLFARPEEHCWFVDVRMDPDFQRSMETRMAERAHLIERSSYDIGERPEQYFDGACQFRWIHIDGEHTAMAVVNDLGIADHQLGPAGVVSVDDFLSPTWPHVAAGVFRYLHEHPGRFDLFLTAYNKGYLTRPESGDFYRDFVHEGFPPHFRSRNFSDYTILETTLLDANDGIHCLGIGNRFENEDFILCRASVGRS